MPVMQKHADVGGSGRPLVNPISCMQEFSAKLSNVTIVFILCFFELQQPKTKYKYIQAPSVYHDAEHRLFLFMLKELRICTNGKRRTHVVACFPRNVVGRSDQKKNRATLCEKSALLHKHLAGIEENLVVAALQERFLSCVRQYDGNYSLNPIYQYRNYSTWTMLLYLQCYTIVCGSYTVVYNL